LALALCAGCAVLGLTLPAFADTTPAATAIDFSPVVQAIIGVGATVLTGIGGWALKWIAARTKAGAKLEQDAAMRDALHKALENAVHFGASYALTWAGSTNWANKNVKNALFTGAAQYVNVMVPDAVNYFGLDQPKLAGLIEARMSQLTGILPTLSDVAAGTTVSAAPPAGSAAAAGPAEPAAPAAPPAPPPPPAPPAPPRQPSDSFAVPPAATATY